MVSSSVYYEEYSSGLGEDPSCPALSHSINDYVESL